MGRGEMRIGIDNGISGGLVALSDYDGSYIDGIPMPIQSARKGNEIDVMTVRAWLKQISGEDSTKVASVTIEEPGGSKSAQACASMAGSFHALRTVLTLGRYRWHRVTPQAWQKVMLPCCKAGDTKKRALEYARRAWPEETFLASPRCKVPHDGMIDAALIAEYSRRMKL